MLSREGVWKVFAHLQRIIHSKRLCLDCVNDIDHTHCYVCDVLLFFNRGAAWHVSHLQAQKLGGPDDDYNLRICCGGCNQRMWTATPYAYAKSLGLTVKNSLAMQEKINNKYDAELVYNLIYVKWISKYTETMNLKDSLFEEAFFSEDAHREKMKQKDGTLVVGEFAREEDSSGSSSSSSSVPISETRELSPETPGKLHIVCTSTIYYPSKTPSSKVVVPQCELTKTTRAKDGTGKITKVTKAERDYLHKLIESFMYGFITCEINVFYENSEPSPVTRRPIIQAFDNYSSQNTYTIDVQKLMEIFMHKYGQYDHYSGKPQFFYEVLVLWCKNNGVIYTSNGKYFRDHAIIFTSKKRPLLVDIIPLGPYPWVVRMKSKPKTIYVDGSIDSYLSDPNYISHEKYCGEREDILQGIEYYKKESTTLITEVVKDWYNDSVFNKELNDYWVTEKGASVAYILEKVKFVVFFDTEEHFTHNELIHTEREFRCLRRRDRRISAEVLAEGCFLIRIDYTTLSETYLEIQESYNKSSDQRCWGNITTPEAKYHFSKPEMYTHISEKIG